MNDTGTATALSAQPRTGRRWYILGALLLLLAGAVGGSWAMDRYLDWRSSDFGRSPNTVAAAAAGPNSAVQRPANPDPVAPLTTTPPTDLAGRVQQLETRLATLSLTNDSLSGNAARAEALLIAFAVRRALDRGLALGTLESQLRLRFGDAQPNAVRTVITAAATPVTLDWLQSEFDRLTPELAGKSASTSLWSGLRREVGELFVLHDGTATSTRADERVVQARRLLGAGVVDGAIREVAALPDAARAAAWLEEARRYHEARRALDLIETAAILAPQENIAPTLPPTRR